MNELDMELLKTLAEMQGETVEVRDGAIIMTNDCPSYGGTYFAANEQGLKEAIDLYTHEALNPLE